MSIGATIGTHQPFHRLQHATELLTTRKTSGGGQPGPTRTVISANTHKKNRVLLAVAVDTATSRTTKSACFHILSAERNNTMAAGSGWQKVLGQRKARCGPRECGAPSDQNARYPTCECVKKID